MHDSADDGRDDQWYDDHLQCVHEERADELTKDFDVTAKRSTDVWHERTGEQCGKCECE